MDSPWLINLNIFFHWSLVLILGLLIGSFFALIVVRLPQGESIVRPRSFCRHCGHSIPWWQNIPVLSFLFLRGRCAFCQQALSLLYPVIELSTALVLLISYFFLKPEMRFLLWSFTFVLPLTLLFFLDLQARILPNALTLTGIFLGFTVRLTDFFLIEKINNYKLISNVLLESFLGALLGFGLLFGLAWAYEKWRGRPGLGGGDLKLAAALGAFLGPEGLLWSLWLGSVLGLLLSFPLLLTGKVNPKSPLPLGSFLALAALFYLFSGANWHLKGLLGVFNLL